MKKTPEELKTFAAHLEKASPQEVKDVFAGLSELFETRTKPARINEETLTDCYSSLASAANYHQLLPAEEKEEHRRNNLDVLTMVEFQAGWYVLRHFFNDDEIDGLRKSRQERYLRYLYSFPEKFSFYEQRETALEKLSQIDFINPADYRIEAPLRLSYP